MSKTEIDTLKLKQRPIVRLGIFLISHSLLFSVLCCTAGVFALFLLPILAKSTYISENALMPGSADPMLSNHEVSEANRLVKDVLASHSESRRASIVTQRLIAQYMSDLGAEVSIHKFHPHSVQFHPLSFFSNLDSSILEQNISFSSYGVNTIGIVRAPRGDGKETIVLVTPYNSVKISQAEAFSLGIAYSVFSLLTRVTWLAKDIIWLVADSHYGEYAAVAAWLRDYHTPAFTGPHTVDSETCLEADDQYEVKGNPYKNKSICYGFRRSGTMAAALVIKAVDKSEQFEDSLSLYAEASNGQMPNLDLINIVNYLAAHRQGFRVKVNKFWSIHEFKWLNILGELLESVGQVIRSLNPQWKFGIPAADYVDGAATLASSFYNQALGVPTGSHGAFRDYQVDAITLEISSKASLYNKNRQKEFLLRGGRLIEGVIRSVNNLLEKFHQSFFLYLLTSPSKFVSVGVYMIAFVLLVAPLPIAAASLYANNLHAMERKDKPAPADEAAIILTSWKWINAAKKVFVVHFWGFVILLLPYLICQIPHLSPTTSLIIWFSFSVFGLLVLYIILASSSHQSSADCSTTELLRNNRRLDLMASQFQIREWAILKSVTISAAFIGLCLMSVINFATAEIGGLLIVPMCLMAQPLRLDVKGRNLRSFSRLACNLAFAIVGFPPAAFILLKGTFEGFNGVNVGDFWNWLESLWAWSSATYLYIGMVHLPCWVLCIDILFHCC